MNLKAISLGKNVPDDVNVVIEVPIGGEPIKYEIDKDAGALVVDRFLYTSMRYPGNYGFIPHTLSDDGDPCDVIVANTRAIIPGAIMSVRPVGLTAFYDGVDSYKDLPAIQVAQIEHFFAHYKDLEPGKWTKLKGWQDADVAKKMILEGVERANAEGYGYQGS